MRERMANELFQFHQAFCIVEIQDYVSAKKLVLYKIGDLNEKYSCRHGNKKKEEKL